MINLSDYRILKVEGILFCVGGLNGTGAWSRRLALHLRIQSEPIEFVGYIPVHLLLAASHVFINFSEALR